jgi:anti-anti-sigma factor
LAGGTSRTDASHAPDPSAHDRESHDHFRCTARPDDARSGDAAGSAGDLPGRDPARGRPRDRHPSGELDLATVDGLGGAINGLVDAGFKTVVLDLRRLTFIDSTGLRLIVRESRRPDVRLRLIDGVGDVTGLFEIRRVRAWLSFMDARELRRSPAF